MAIMRMDIGLGSGYMSLDTYLRRIDENTKRVYFDTDRLSKSAKSMGDSFKNFGIGALGALTAIAATAPSLAGQMAQLEIAGFRISEAIGNAAAPAVSAFAGAVEGIAGFLEQNKWAANLAAGVLSIGAAIGVLNLGGLALGIQGVGAAAMSIAFGPAAPLIILTAAIIAAHDAFSSFVSDAQKQSIADVVGNIPVVGGAMGYGTEAVVGTAGAISSVTTPIISSILDATGISDILGGAGSLLGMNNKSLESFGASFSAKQQTPGGAMGYILIQILDQDGQRRDQIVISGGQGGVTN